jgi:hypothetical protein
LKGWVVFRLVVFSCCTGRGVRQAGWLRAAPARPPCARRSRGHCHCSAARDLSRRRRGLLLNHSALGVASTCIAAPDGGGAEWLRTHAMARDGERAVAGDGGRRGDAHTAVAPARRASASTLLCVRASACRRCVAHGAGGDGFFSRSFSPFFLAARRAADSGVHQRGAGALSSFLRGAGRSVGGAARSTRPLCCRSQRPGGFLLAGLCLL